MTVLSPTNLETTDYGQQGWNAVHSANMQRLNTYLNKLWALLTGAKNPGADSVADAAAVTAEALTDSTGGTVSQSVQAFVYSGGDSNWDVFNKNFASLTDEINKLRVDNAQLRTTVNALLVALRKSTGCGVLAG
jgi:hypothetical protein